MQSLSCAQSTCHGLIKKPYCFIAGEKCSFELLYSVFSIKSWINVGSIVEKFHLITGLTLEDKRFEKAVFVPFPCTASLGKNRKIKQGWLYSARPRWLWKTGKTLGTGSALDWRGCKHSGNDSLYKEHNQPEPSRLHEESYRCTRNVLLGGILTLNKPTRY